MFLRIAFSACLLFAVITGCVHAAPSNGISNLGYSIQVGAFSEVRNAERLTVKLQEKGIEAFYFRRENGFYAVRFGDYPNRGVAGIAAKKLVSDKVIEAYFIAEPQFVSKKALPLSETPDHGPKVKKLRDKGMGDIAARTAERFVGIPYRWGGNTVVDGMDCSGFARAVYNLCGVNIPRTSSEQFKVGEEVSRDALEDGDLVFFGNSESGINHVGIYVGNDRFVHAPKRGDDIKVSSIKDNGFSKKFMGGRRYF